MEMDEINAVAMEDSRRLKLSADRWDRFIGSVLPICAFPQSDADPDWWVIHDSPKLRESTFRVLDRARWWDECLNFYDDHDCDRGGCWRLVVEPV